MKIQTTAGITDLDGSPIKLDANTNLTLRTVLTNALLTPRQGDAQLDGTEKLKRFKLAQRIHDETEVEASAEEVVQLKTLVAETYPTLVTAKALLLLDPAAP